MTRTSVERSEMPGKGLEDIIAAETSVSDIDGKQGRLFYAGYDIHQLVEASFEEITYLLHNIE
ncbi:MAG: citrate/2-methylcitrate synthase, partial [Actinomycetota bacterium]